MRAGNNFLMQSGDGFRCAEMKVMEELNLDMTLVPRCPE